MVSPKAPPPPPTFAGLPVGDGLAHVPVVALLAVVAVAARRVVAAVEADAPALASRQFVELHVEAAASGVQVAVAGCGGGRRGVRKGAPAGGPQETLYPPPPAIPPPPPLQDREAVFFSRTPRLPCLLPSVLPTGHYPNHG